MIALARYSSIISLKNTVDNETQESDVHNHPQYRSRKEPTWVQYICKIVLKGNIKFSVHQHGK